MGSGRYTALRVLGVVGVRALSAILSFLFSLEVAYLFGAAGFGAWVSALAVTSLAAVVVRLGLDNIVLREISSSLARGEPEQAVGTYRRAMLLSFTCGCMITIAIVVAAQLLPPTWAPDATRHLLLVLASGVVPGALLHLHGESLKAVGHPTTASAVAQVLPTLVALVVVWLTAPGFGLQSVGIGIVLADVVALAVAYSVWHRLTRGYRLSAPRLPRVGTLMRMALPLLIVSITAVVIGEMSVIILSRHVEQAEVGAFGAATRLAMMMLLPLQATTAVIAPRMSALYAQGMAWKLAPLIQSANRSLAALMSPVALVLVVAPGAFLGVFGEGFSVGAPALRVLAIAQLVNVATGPVSALLVMTGHQLAFLYNSLVWAVATIALSIVLIPIWGALGAAAATGIAIAGLNVVNVLMAKRLLRIPLGWFHRGGDRPGVGQQTARSEDSVL